MKKTSMVMAAIAVASLLLAMAGCDMQVRDTYVNKTTGVVTEDNGKYSLTSTNLSSYVTTVDGQECIDLEAAGSGGSGAASALSTDAVKWENPLAGKTLTGVTIAFDVYPDTTGTYSGVLGLYNKTTGGFLWFTDTQFFLNTNANTDTAAADFSYIDAVSLGTTSGKWQKIAVVIDASGYAVYNAGVKIKSGTALNGVDTSVGNILTFLTDKADVVVAGVGATFWDNSALAGTYIKNISVYDTALSTSDLATLFGTTITDDTSKSLDVLNVDLSDEADSRIGTVSATLNGVSVFSGVDAQDGWWAHQNGTTLVQMTPHDTLVYTFTGSTASTDSWNSWYLHFWKTDNTAGNVLRADNWLGNNLCSSSDPGIWTAGSSSANGTYYNNYSSSSAAAATSSNTFTMSVYFDGSNVYVKMMIDDTLAYTTNSTLWK